MAINLEVNVNPIPLGVEPGNVDLGVGGSYIQSPIIPDNSITDAKLVQEGGVLSAVADLEDRVEAIEADYATASDLDALSDEVRNSLAITDTASGAVASFPDGADGQKVRSLVAKIEPKQAGSGDPSPTNIRPITGCDGVTVRRSGKNLFPGCYQGTIDQTTGQEGTGTNSITTFIRVKPNGTYTVSQFTGSSIALRVFRYNLAKGYIGTQVYSTSSGSFTVTSDANTEYIRLQASTQVMTVGGNYQFEEGSVATPYEPYSGTTLSTQFPSTVYGGEVDLVSGVLRVDRAIVQFDGSSMNNITMQSTNTSGKYRLNIAANRFVPAHVSPTSSGVVGNIQTNLYKSEPADRTFQCINGIASRGGGAYIYDENLQTTEAFASAWQTTPLQIVYELATPTEVQLTAQDLETLKGVNNVWADTGDTSVVYLADTKLYIDKKLTELVAQIVNS